MPVVARVLHAGITKVVDKRNRRATEALEVAVNESHLPIEQVFERALEDEHRTELLARALAVATAATTRAKILALGRSLATGLLADDTARVDEEILLVDALARIEGPHLRLLQRLSSAPPMLDPAKGDGYGAYGAAWRAEQVVHHDSGVADALPGAHCRPYFTRPDR